MGAADGRHKAVGDQVAALGQTITATMAPAEQMELIGLPANLPADVAERARESVRARGRGRPRGATNRATEEVKAFCRRVFGFDPLIEGFRWAQHTPESLAIVLGCSKLEAFDRLEALRRDLARYFHAPVQPVDANGQAVPTFVVQVGANQVAIGAPGAPAAAPWLGDPRRVQLEQNQALSETVPATSHGAPSHEPAK